MEAIEHQWGVVNLSYLLSFLLLHSTAAGNDEIGPSWHIPAAAFAWSLDIGVDTTNLSEQAATCSQRVVPVYDRCSYNNVAER